MSGKTKILYMLTAIICSFMLWFYVVGVENPVKEEVISGIPVTIIGEEKLYDDYSLILTSDKKIEASLRISGKLLDVSSLKNRKSEITAIVDISGLSRSGEYPRPIEYSLPVENVTIVERIDYIVTIKLESRISKNIPVYCRNEATVSEGFIAEPVLIDPETIQISGVEESIGRVAYAEVVLSRDNVERTVNAALDITLYDENDTVVNDENITLSRDSVDITLTVFKEKTVPLVVEIIAGGGATEQDVRCDIEPKTVTIAGDAAQLEVINSITVGMIDLRKIWNTEKNDFTIPYPNGIKRISGEESCTVSAEITGLDIDTFMCDNIDIINNPDGYSIDIISNQILVEIRGKREDLSLVSDYNIRIVADLGGVPVSTGKYSVPVAVYIDGHPKVGAVGEYKIAIQVT